jgi:hypothetical protein
MKFDISLKNFEKIESSHAASVSLPKTENRLRLKIK